MKIVVSGASGALGSALVPELRSSGHEVLRLVRREARSSDEVSWDPATGSIDADALAGIDAAINVSGANIGRRWTTARRREIRESRIATTGLLARTLARLVPRPHTLMQAGAVGIYGDRGDEILTEESDLGAGFLADLGKDWEAAADPAREAGVRVATFRQGIVLSKAPGGALARMLPFFKLGVGGRVGSGRQWLSWISLEDLVRAYQNVLATDLSGPINLCSPNPVTNAQFTKALGRVLRRPTLFPVPGVVIKTIWGEMGDVALLEGQRTLPARLADTGFEFAYADLDAALARALER